MTTITRQARDAAISAARALAQTIWERTYTQDHYLTAYYVERDGRITSDDYIGSHERESVYYGHEGCAARLHTVGRSGVGYNGDETDYRDINDEISISPEHTGRAGRYLEDHLTVDDLPADLAAQYPEGLYWDDDAWHPLEDRVCSWRRRDVDDPSHPLVEAIEALPAGWFDDEAAL